MLLELRIVPGVQGGVDATYKSTNLVLAPMVFEAVTAILSAP